MIKNVISAIIGSILEYYDYMLFASMVPILSSIYFPKDIVSYAFIKTYLIGFLGTIGRPLGGILFGYIGDNFGRKPALYLSMLLMSISTGSIVLLPDYNSIGNYAPFLLFLCRFFQSMSAGGESAGAAIFLIENFKEKNSYSASSLTLASFGLGVVFSVLAAYLVNIYGDQYWKIPFIFGLFIAVISFFIRIYTKESAVFLNKKKTIDEKVSLKNILIAITIAGSTTGLLYYSLYFIHDYLKITNILSLKTILFIRLFMLCFYVISLLIISTINYDLKKIMSKACLAMVVYIIPGLYIIQSGNILLIIFSEMIFVGITALIVAPLYSILYNLFPINSRYRNIAFFYSIGSWILGSSTSTICSTLWSKTNVFYSPSLWIIPISFSLYLVLQILEKSDDILIVSSDSKVPAV